MFSLSKNFRRLLSCLLLAMLMLQGIAQVSADVLPEAHNEQHCASHDPGQDCSCCSAAMAMAGGCAALCSVSIAVLAIAISVPRVDTDDHQRVAVQGAFGPIYLPLNPPPIS